MQTCSEPIQDGANPLNGRLLDSLDASGQQIVKLHVSHQRLDPYSLSEAILLILEAVRILEVENVLVLW